MSFAIFDENYYLSNYADVKAAVQAGTFKSGLEHFQQYGLAEGRVAVSPYFDEGLYLRKNPDVAAAVKPGGFKTGLQHYIQYGEAEGRSPGSFNEQYYRQDNPDVAAAINTGTFSSGLQHYIRYGQNESRDTLFIGSTGNDTIVGFGTFTGIGGINVGNDLNVGVNIGGANNLVTFDSQDTGRNQIDTLIGGSGQDLFYLSSYLVLNSSIATSQQLYVGGGNADYAAIKNFERGKDAITLAGTLSGYNLQAVNGNLNISTKAGDLIGIVEGVTSLSLLRDNNLLDGTSLAG